MITQKFLKNRFNYDENTGVFTFKVFAGSKRPGEPAGCVTPKGYIHISIDSKAYKAHRLAWLYVYGVMPECDIDHIDHNKENNAISNLRLVTQIENSKNRPKDKRNSCGVTGVYLQDCGTWRARITVNRKTIHLGIFNTLDEAKEARLVAEMLYGFHNNHGE